MSQVTNVFCRLFSAHSATAADCQSSLLLPHQLQIRHRCHNQCWLLTPPGIFLNCTSTLSPWWKQKVAFIINHLAGRAKLQGLLSRRDSLQPVPPSSLHWGGGESWCPWDGWLAGLFVCSTFRWSLGVLTVCLCHLWPADWIGVVGLWCHSVSNCWGWRRFHCDPQVPTVALDGHNLGTMIHQTSKVHRCFLATSTRLYYDLF